MNQDAKKIVKIGSVSLLFLIIIIFVFIGSRDLIFGVKIKNVQIINIMDGSTTPGEIMRITGNAKNAINLSINGRIISIDQQGNFDETIALLLGYNIIDIKAEDKFKNSDEKNYKLILK